MLIGSKTRSIIKKAAVSVLSLAMLLTMMPVMAAPVYAEDSVLQTQTPVLVATGTELTGSYDSSELVSAERSWTLDELKALDGVEGQMYSAKQQKSPYTKSYNIVDGVKVSSLLGDLSKYSVVKFFASDGYSVSFRNNADSYDYENPGTEDVAGLASGRYYYEGFGEEPTEEVPVVISWAFDRTEGSNQQPPANMPLSTVDQKFLRLFCGQLAEPGLGSEDKNGQLFNGKNDSATMQRVVAGDIIQETALTVGSKEYTRADVLLMDFAEAEYTYDTSNGSATDCVRGVPMAVLLNGYDDSDIVTFEAADGYDVSVSGYTVKQLIDNDYILAYEKGSDWDSLEGIYETAKKDPSKHGFLRLYGGDENGKPAKMVNSITVTTSSGTDYSKSPYKHITNGGQEGSDPYNIDSITGATLTVEGPGVKSSVPVSVRDLEGRNGGIKRADYTDKRSGSNITRTYEGVELYYILHNMSSGSTGIKLTEKAAKVLIKNRNRNTIAEFTLDQIEQAHNSETPIIVAYGTSLTDGTNIRPFVFDNGEGADSGLGNEDGCIKLVYDKGSITGDINDGYTKFGNMAYIYVAEEETPGYKHDKDPYQSADISNYVLTVTGDKIGREVNYTVSQLENMVEYGSDGKPDNTGMGYRDEYSLANSNYWYVNEYEGVQLWKLLLRSGLDKNLADDPEGSKTIVSSTATDGYTATDKFTIGQVSDPDLFGFYEKNPADNNDGKYEGNENIREGDDVSTGDKLRVGYPVLVAYGVNGYPYVEKSSQAGYLSGLENDGGPLRIISGKIRYNHANGSNQAKLLDKIIVGDNEYHYSTHKYHEDQVYKDMADADKLSVTILNGPDNDAPVIKDTEYKVGDIEDLIYDNKLTFTQLKEAKIKTFYQLKKGSKPYSDLYEGIDLGFFLKNIVEIPGYKGTITFSNGTDTLSLNLDDVLSAKGSNTETGMSDLTPVLAFAKNGAPMVTDKNADGYQNEITLGTGTDQQNTIEVKNDGGPLAVLFPHTDSDVSDKSITNVTSITINLSADKYAHLNPPYDSYKENTITIFGEGTRLAEPKAFTLSELEGKQTIAFTGDYSILKDGGGSASQARYRGINLYSLLTSTTIGLRSNADKVIIRTSDKPDEPIEFTLSEIRKTYMNSVTGETGLPVILAYGAGKAGEEDKEDGLPLVAEKDENGYVSVYGNNGGPVRLVVGQSDAADVNSGRNLKFVSSIEVTASEIDSWNHSVSDIFRKYLTETVNLQVVDSEDTELFNKDYTIADIEANTNLVDRTEAKTTQINTWEGINLWAFVTQETEGISGIDDPVKVEVTAEDGTSKEMRSIFGMDALRDGVKDGELYVPILLAYGVDGMPLVIGDKTHGNGEGYDATVGNNGGPIRLVTHNNQGASLTYVKKIKVTIGESGQPEETADFTIKGLKGGDIELSVNDIKNLKNKSGDAVGQAEAQYVRKGVTKTVKGALLKDILAAQGVELEGTVITLHTPDSFEETPKGESYNNITLKQAVNQEYFLAYQEKDSETGAWKDIDDTVKGMDVHTNLRMYRYYCEANGLSNQDEWYDECANIIAVTLEVPEVTAFKEYATSSVRSAVLDKDNTLWVGTYGGGLFYKDAGNRSFRVMNTNSDPALLTDFTSGAAADDEGGIWVSQNASYTNPTNNQGVLYIKDGTVTQYKAEDSPATIADNYVQAIKVDTDGKVWFGSFGGLTIYDPNEGTWTTYNKETSDFPATSINTIVLDGSGGAWLGFYPDGSGTEDDLYTGGFCHIDKDGVVSEKTVVSGEMTKDGSTSKLAQAWVRSIAIDKKGTVWVVASGTNLKENEGGTVWKLKNGTGEPSKYTGDELFGDYLDGSDTTEVRVVAVDEEGSLWFGTSADGVLKVDNPKLNEDGSMNVTAQYAKENGSWSAANRNNVYYIGFMNGGTAYVGSAGGLQVLGDEPTSDKESTGGETVDTATLTIDGRGVVKNGYFSVKTLKNADGVNKVDAVYRWMNKSGTTGRNTFQGVYLDNLLKDVIGLNDGVRYVTVITEDGKEARLDIAEIETEDLDGHKPMIAWQSDEDPENSKINPKLVVGQTDRDEANKGSWMKDVVEIRVDMPTVLETEQYAAIDEINESVDLTDYSAENKKTVVAAVKSAAAKIKASKTAAAVAAAKTEAQEEIAEVEKKEVIGGKTKEDATFKITGDGAVKNGYFDVKSLKGSGVVKQEGVTYSWKNNGGSTGSNTFDGAYLNDLFCNVIGLEEGARSFTVISGDKEKKFEISIIDVEDKDGNLPMIAWQSDEDPSNPKIDPKLVIGQADENDANKGSWISNVIEIRIDLPTEVELAQDAAVGEIMSSVDINDYDRPEQEAVSEAIASATESIRAAATLDEVEDALAAGMEAISQIKTSAQKAEELAQAKKDAAEAVSTAATEAKAGLADVADEEAKKAAEDKIDKIAASAAAKIDEVSKIENVAPIAAEAAQSINDTAADTITKAKEKALAEKKSAAIQEVMDYLEENRDNTDAAASTKAALDAVLAISNASDTDAVDAAVQNAKDSIDGLVAEKAAADAKAAADKAAADAKAAADKAAAEATAAAERDKAAQAAYQSAVKAAKAGNLQVKGFKVKAVKGKKAKLSWKKTNGASGYEIYRSTKKNGKYKLVKTITKGTTVKVTNKKLKAKKKYYYRIRPYKMVKDPTGQMAKVYGKYSAKKKIKVKK